MQRIICGGTGLIGRRLVKHWLHQQHSVTVIGRTQQHIQQVFSDTVSALTWDELNVGHLRGADVVVNLAGASIGEKRWTEKRKTEIIDSRVGPTTQLATLLASLGEEAPPLFNASAIGIYGLQDSVAQGLPPAFTEQSEIDWQAAPDFLALVGRKWEQAAQAAIDQHVRVVFLRFGVVLSKKGGALPQLLRALRFGVGRIGSGKQAFTWVALRDVVRAIDFLIKHPKLSGPFNVVAPGAVTQSSFVNTLGTLLYGKKPSFFLPGIVVKIMFGEMGEELLLKGQHVISERFPAARFEFHYPQLETALNHILK